MKAGKLRHRVTIQHKAYTRQGQSGVPIYDWSDLATVWASVEPLSVREFIASHATQGELTARITMRHRADVDETMRLTFRGKVYNIEGVLDDPKSGLEYMTLAVSEGTNEG